MSHFLPQGKAIGVRGEELSNILRPGENSLQGDFVCFAFNFLYPNISAMYHLVGTRRAGIDDLPGCLA